MRNGRFGFAGLLLALLASPASSAYLFGEISFVRDDPLDTAWLWGNLTWAAGRGGLVWGEPGGSEAHGGFGGTAANPTPRQDTFVSEPLPTEVYLNASRHIQLDLVVVKYICSAGTVELLVGDTHLAGAAVCHSFYGKPAPMAPAGHALHAYRMPPEMSYLPRGSVLSLRITVPDGSAASNIGTAPPQNSILRLPLLSPEEAAYRMPEVFPERRELPASHVARDAQQRVDALQGVSGLAGFALAIPGALGTRGRSRPAHFLAGFVLLMGAMAGCLGDSSRPSGESGPGPATAATVSYVDTPSQPGSAAYGSIAGRVYEASGLPVERAFVAVLNTPNGTFSDRTGFFSFRLPDAGTYAVRVDHQDYRSVEVPVQVRLGSIARVDITLQAVEEEVSDVRPHRHDYWQGQEKAEVFSEPLMEQCFDVDCHAAAKFYLPLDPSPGKRLIRPGTNEVVVNLTWDVGTTHYARIGLAVRPNHDPGERNWSLYFPRASGQPFRIQTTWEMADVGHQLFSTWAFGAGPGLDPVDPGPVVRNNEEIRRRIGETWTLIESATIQIQRGALPLEPSHPDHWDGQASTVIEPGVKVREGSAACTKGDRFSMALGSPSKVVPPESTSLVLTGKQERPNLRQTVASYSWRLFYKTGDTPLSPYMPNHPYYREAEPGQVTADGLVWTWNLDVPAGKADGTYNKKSAWSFTLVPSNFQLACADSQPDNLIPEVTWSLRADRAADG